MKLNERFNRRNVQEIERFLKEKQAKLKGAARGVLSTRLATEASRYADPVEQATETLHDEMQVAFLDSVSLHLAQIEVTLERLARGEYGLCHECGASIEPARLRALPFALRCTACQSRRELEMPRDTKVLPNVNLAK